MHGLFLLGQHLLHRSLVLSPEIEVVCLEPWRSAQPTLNQSTETGLFLRPFDRLDSCRISPEDLQVTIFEPEFLFHAQFVLQ